MASRKKKPVLYELVQQRRPRERAWGPRAAPAAPATITTAPRPPSPTPPTAPAQPTPRSAAPATAALPPQSPAPPSSASATGPVRFAHADMGAKALRLVPFPWHEGSVSLSLAWSHLVVLGVAILVMLYLAYRLGGRVSNAAEPAASLADVGVHVENSPPAGLSTSEARPTEHAAPENAPVLNPNAERARPPLPEPEPLRPRGGGAATPLTVGAATPGEAEAAPLPPAPPVAETTPPPPEPERAFEFVPGQWYVLVQYFPKSRGAAAKQARDFLDARGISAYVEERRADLALYATDAFDDARKAQSLAERIKRLGREYAPIGGYDFGQSQPIKR